MNEAQMFSKLLHRQTCCIYHCKHLEVFRSAVIHRFLRLWFFCRMTVFLSQNIFVNLNFLRYLWGKIEVSFFGFGRLFLTWKIWSHPRSDFWGHSAVLGLDLHENFCRVGIWIWNIRTNSDEVWKHHSDWWLLSQLQRNDWCERSGVY